ncbi:MAG: response regulator [Nitrospirae bacterium]|nr:response regulator [Nitrospirota bacterium]
MRILIVDDDMISSTLISRILRKGGYQTLVAPSAKKALEFMEAGEAVMLMILDVMLPDMNGLDLLELIHKRPGLNCIPVIICSGDRLRESVVRSGKMGISDYLLKPIDGVVLLEKIGNALRFAGPPLADRDRIMVRLKIELDAYEEMLDTLIQNTSAVIQEAPVLIKDKKNDDLLFLLQRLQGGAGSLGAEHFSRVLAKISNDMQRSDFAETGDILIALQREYNILCEVVKGSISSNVPHTVDNSDQPQKEQSVLSSLERDALEKKV